MNKSVTEIAVNLEDVRIGKVMPIGSNNITSAIKKSSVKTPVAVNFQGIEGDEHADTKHHGGKEKAIHHYPLEHYQYWQQILRQFPCVIEAGLFGENVSTYGLSEHNVYIGDIYQVGSTILQVSQARQPCWKLNEITQVEDMATRVQASLRTGWYYRVLETGQIEVGDSIRLMDRTEPLWPIIRLLKTLYENTLDYDALHQISEIDSLTDSWKTLAKKRLESKQVENWYYRLTNPSRQQ